MEYTQIIRKNHGIIALLVVMIPVTIFVSLLIGYTDVSLNELLEIFTGSGTEKGRLIVLEFRLPRMMIALLVGIGFSVAGCILQGLTGNPLADPGILGINAGAGLVVVVFMTAVGTLNFSSIMLLPFLAMVGAAVTGFTIYSLSSHRYKGLHGTSLILNGIAVQAGINAAMMIIILTMDRDQHDFLARWQAGSIWNSHWKLVGAVTPWIAVCFILAMAMAKYLDILVLGDDSARALGLKIKSAKRNLLLLAVTIAAASVAVSGSISFIGLLSPHIGRRLVGNRHKFLIPVSGLIGGLMMLIADVIARKIAEPLELPTGIVVAAVGAPYFFFLLLKGSKAVKRR